MSSRKPVESDHAAWSFEPIGFIRSPLPQKFGVPRQPGLATSIQSTLELSREGTGVPSLLGLAEFSHVFVLFVFHKSLGWKQTVRPPRLGGDRKRGVFATRSPFRPNPIGLSVCALLDVEAQRLTLGGSDLVDGTPVLDLKPYLPWSDAVVDARAGWASAPPTPKPVRVVPELEAELAPALAHQLRDLLRWDPRPAYQDDPERVYGFRFAGHEVEFRVDESGVVITKVWPSPSDTSTLSFVDPDQDADS